jgi:hypothetical protein
MANEEISMDSMRLLFSLLDTDGGGALSPEEIRKGMLLLGFEEAHDPVALGRLIQSIDEDQAGTVSESEFLSFMSKESRNSLKDKLSEWSLKCTHMQATRYPTSGALNLEIAELSTEATKSLICEALKAENSFNYWIEVVGYNKTTISSLAEALGISHDDLANALLFSVPICRHVDSANAPAACIILHQARMSVDPVLPRPRSFLPAPLTNVIDAIIGGDSVNIKPPELLRGCNLAHKDVVCDAVVTLEQAAILVVSDRLVVTLRLPSQSIHSAARPYSASKVGADSSREPHWAPLSATACESGMWSFPKDASSVQAAFDKLRQRLPTLALQPLAAADSRTAGPRSFTARAPARSNGGAKLLAVLLADCLVGSLREMRNRMQDWDELLDASIRGKQCSANTIHLEAMDSIAVNFKAILDPLARALDPSLWAESAGGGAETGTPVSFVPQASDGGRGGDGGGSAAANQLRRFFQAELKYFKELAGDVGPLVHSELERNLEVACTRH